MAAFPSVTQALSALRHLIFQDGYVTMALNMHQKLLAEEATTPERASQAFSTRSKDLPCLTAFLMVANAAGVS